jgi:hypothetical protein
MSCVVVVGICLRRLLKRGRFDMAAELEQPLLELEREFRRRDPYNAGVVSRSEFTFVLVRSGGMLTQIDALADSFSCGDSSLLGVHSTVDYLRFIRHMRSLANDGPVSQHASDVCLQEDFLSRCETLAAESLKDTLRAKDSFEVESGTVAQKSSKVEERAGNVSLRFVFKHFGGDTHSKISLNEVLDGFRSIGAAEDVTRLSLEALCDAIFDDDGSSERFLNLEEFCLLVSRLPSKTIQLLRNVSTWKSTTQAPSFDQGQSTQAPCFDQGQSTQSPCFDQGQSTQAPCDQPSAVRALTFDQPSDESLAIPAAPNSHPKPPSSDATKGSIDNKSSLKVNLLATALQRFQQPTRSSQRKSLPPNDQPKHFAHKTQKTRSVVESQPLWKTSRASSRSISPAEPKVEKIKLPSREEGLKPAAPQQFRDPESPSSVSCDRTKLLELLGPQCNTLMSLCSDLDQLKRGIVRFESLYAVVSTLTQGSHATKDAIKEVLLPYRRVGMMEWVDYAQFVGDIIIVATPLAKTTCASTTSPPVTGDSTVRLKALHQARANTPSLERPPCSLSLEERVRVGQERIQRLLKHELLDCCSYDGQLLIDALLRNSVSSWYVDEKQLRSNVLTLFQVAAKPLPSWVADRAIKIARIPFEMENITREPNHTVIRDAIEISSTNSFNASLCDVRYLLAQLRVVS